MADVPGSVTSILTLINNFNISYISSQENGTEYQYFKMGLFVEDFDKISEFLKEAEKLCKVSVIDYNSSEKVYDNSIFYNNYVMGLSQTAGLSEDVCRELLVHVNLAMQTLDEQGLSPYRTFDSIKKTILITHADVDHCGLLPVFDEIIASRKTCSCLKKRAPWK